MIHIITFLIQNIVLPLVIAWGILLFDQRWHGQVEYKRAFNRSISLGINSKLHPEKVTLEALFIASEAELEYACDLVNKDFEETVREVQQEIAKSTVTLVGTKDTECQIQFI